MITNPYAQENLGKIINSPNQYSDLYVILGDLERNSISYSIKVLEQKLNNLNYSRSLVTRAKLIGVELLDNIYKHQEKEATLNPYFEFSLNDKELRFTSANCVSKKAYDFLNSKLKEYSKLSVKELKGKYIGQLKEGQLDDLGNAGVGLFSILQRSAKNVEYKLSKVKDGEYYFNFVVKIANTQKN